MAPGQERRREGKGYVQGEVEASGDRHRGALVGVEAVPEGCELLVKRPEVLNEGRQEGDGQARGWECNLVWDGGRSNCEGVYVGQVG